MSIMLSDFHLSNHSFFSQGLGICFVMCKLEKFIVQARPSDSICLVLPILGTWEALALLSAAQRAAPLQVMGAWSLYSQSMHVGLSHPPCRGTQGKPSTFTLCDHTGQSKVNKGRFEVFLTLCSEDPTAVSGDSCTVWLPADGETGRWLLNQDIPPEALGNFICSLSVLKDCKSIFTGKLCREQRLMFF